MCLFPISQIGISEIGPLFTQQRSISSETYTDTTIRSAKHNVLEDPWPSDSTRATYDTCELFGSYSPQAVHLWRIIIT